MASCLVTLFSGWSLNSLTCSSTWRPSGAWGLDSGSCSSILVASLFPCVSTCERYSEEPYCFLLELGTKSLLSSCAKENKEGWDLGTMKGSGIALGSWSRVCSARCCLSPLARRDSGHQASSGMSSLMCYFIKIFFLKPSSNFNPSYRCGVFCSAE